MSTFVLKGKPPIKLLDLLKKKKLTLSTFLKDTGVVTYQKLQEKCRSLGVSPPSEEEFKKVIGEPISSPQEGVVVLDPPILTKDSGQKVDVDNFFSIVEQASAPVEDPKEDVGDFKSRQKKTKKS